MAKRFIISFIAVYTFNSFSGYFIHHVLLGEAYRALQSVLHSEEINKKIWAFIVTSATGAFFFTLIYISWQKRGTVVEGIKYGFFIGLWMSLNMALNTYAGTGLIPFSLAMKWLICYLIQYSFSGAILGLVYKKLSQFKNEQ
jgi:hypothetical protein